MNIVAWIVVVVVGINVFGIPFMFGNPRQPYSPKLWVSEIVNGSLCVALAGRVLGWW